MVFTHFYSQVSWYCGIYLKSKTSEMTYVIVQFVLSISMIVAYFIKSLLYSLAEYGYASHYRVWIIWMLYSECCKDYEECIFVDNLNLCLELIIWTINTIWY